MLTPVAVAPAYGPAALLAASARGPERGRVLVADRAEIGHGGARALDQVAGRRAQRAERVGTERAEEQVVDRPDLGAGAVDLQAAGRREAEQDAAAVVRIALLEHQAEAGELAGLHRDEGARHVQRLGDRADADAGRALQLRDRHQHAVLRAADADAAAVM